jgi:hypothetical protein
MPTPKLRSFELIITSSISRGGSKRPHPAEIRLFSAGCASSPQVAPLLRRLRLFSAGCGRFMLLKRPHPAKSGRIVRKPHTISGNLPATEALRHTLVWKPHTISGNFPANGDPKDKRYSGPKQSSLVKGPREARA